MGLKKSELYRSLWSSCTELRGGRLDSKNGAKAPRVKQGVMQELLIGRIRLV